MVRWCSITKPMKHQKEGFREIERFNGTVLIGDEMGLGKSFTSLLWAIQKEKFPAVIICKASLKFNWEYEVRHHFGKTALVLEGRKVTKAKLRALKRAEIIILNFAILGAWVDHLCDLEPAVLILDECQGISNRKTDQYKFTHQLRWNCDHFLPMSGTPLRNRTIELWPVLNMLRPDKFPSFTRFGSKYAIPEYIRGRLVYKGSKNTDRLHRRLLKLCMFRRLKKDILTDLPEMQHNIVPLPYTNKAEYKKAEKNFLSWLGQSYGRGAMVKAKKSQSLTKTGYLRRFIIESKLPYVIEWINDFLEQSEEKLVLMGCHTSAIDKLCEHFGKICVRVDGTVPNAKRKLAVQRFQNDPKCRLFIGNIDAAGEGLTLTKSSTVVFFELDWVPAKIAQGAARVHRISQSKVCQIYYLIAAGTIEERVMQTIESKSAVLNQVLDGGQGDEISVLDMLADMVAKENKKAKRTSLRL